MRLTVVTTATNEASHITRAITSARVAADELILVDGGSTDGTPEVASRLGAKILRHPWAGYGPQKNVGLDVASGDWVFFLDADEEITPGLAGDLRRLIASPPPDLSVGFVRIITFFLGHPLRHLWGTNPRLFRRGRIHWDQRAVHEQAVREDGTVVRLRDRDTVLLGNPLLHPSHYTSLTAYRARRAAYTSRDAADLLATGRDRLGRPVRVRPTDPLSVARFLTAGAARHFLRLAIKKRGLLDGWPGWLWIGLSTWYEVMVARKYLALVRAPGARKAKS